MKIIDKIALNRLIKIIADFVLALCKIFQKVEPNKPVNTPVVPINRPRPLKKIIDSVIPWRKTND